MKSLVRVLTLLILASSTQSSAEPSKASAASPEPRQIADQAMKFVAADDVKGLMEFVRKNMPMEPDQIEKTRETLLTQRKTVSKALGKSLGYALISECRRTDLLLRLVYAEKRVRNAMRWQFIFYKPRDKWLWTYFYWDSDLPQLFVTCD